MAGEREESHAHDWRVTLVVAGEALDGDGLLCDFHDLEMALDAVLGPFENADLNQTPPFDQLNPTAELVVKHIAESVQNQLGDKVHINRVSITEAPGCRATFFLP